MNWMREALRFDFATKPGMCAYSTIVNSRKKPGAPVKGQHVRARLDKPDMAEHVADARLSRCQIACFTDKSMENSYIVSRIGCRYSAWVA